jgi:hypothetical protein
MAQVRVRVRVMAQEQQFRVRVRVMAQEQQFHGA